MTAIVRLGLTAIALLLPGALIAGRLLASTSGDATFDAAQLPTRLGEYVSIEERELSYRALSLIEPEAYAFRLYAADERAVWAYAGFYSGRFQTGAHEPTLCYPALGWEITWSTALQIPMADGGTLHARLMEAQRDGRRELVAYWFQPAHRWPTSPWLEQLARPWDSLIGTPQYAFVRLSLRLPTTQDGASQLKDFASLITPEIRRVLAGASAEKNGGDRRQDDGEV